MRTDYRICPCCGASLDPGEKCDCRVEVERKGRSKNDQREIKLLLGRMDVESLNIVLRFVRHWAYSQARKEGTKNEQ